MSVNIQKQLEHIEDFIIEDNFPQALKLLKKLPSINKITTEDELICLVLKCEILNKQGDFDKAKILADKIIAKGRIMGAKLAIIDALIQKSYALTSVGNYEIAIVDLQLVEEGIKELTNYPANIITKRKAKYNFSCAIYYFSRWNIDEGLKYAKKCLKFADKIKHQDLILLSNFYITSYYLYNGEYETLEKELIEYNKLAESYNSNLFIGLGYFLQADLIRFTDFDFQVSIELYQKCILLIEKSGSKYILYTIYSNLGGLYRDMLELDDALDCYEKSLKLIKVKPALGIVKNHIAYIYRFKGDFDKALKNYYEALELHDQMDIKFLIPGQLYSIIDILVEQENIAVAKIYLDRLKKFASKSDRKYPKDIYDYCNGNILKTLKGSKNLAKAKSIFNKLLRSEMTTDWKIKILMNLTEILLWELEETNNPKTLAEVTKYIYQLQEIADENHYYKFKIDISSLLIDFHLYESNYGDALEILDDSLLLATEKGLKAYKDELKQEKESLISKVNYLKGLDKEKLTREQKKIISNLSGKYTTIRNTTTLEKRDNKGVIIGYEPIFKISF